MMTNPQGDKEKIRLGTRASLLALRQANWVKSRIEERHPGVEVDLVHIRTEGDRIDFPLFDVGGKGLFVKEIEEALLRREVDIAVHSAKDLPMLIPEGLMLLAFPEREDPRDVLISRNGRLWRDLPAAAEVGTSSLRRQAQLLNLRPDLKIVPLRGNLDTRIRKLTSLPLDGIILAAAGLHRMGWGDRVTEYFDPEVVLPAIGQGTLAVEGRAGDERIRRLVDSLNHVSTEVSIKAERAFLGRLEGGCQVPIAAFAGVAQGKIALSGLVAAVDGRRVIRGRVEGDSARSEELGRRLAEELLERGAGEILSEIYRR